ncbi:MAG: DUF4331 family protein [Bdellovibrionota bacterium]
MTKTSSAFAARLVLLLSLLATPFATLASDHDDGEIDLKGRALNITDVYAFREDNQTGVAGDAGNLILIMNTNPRSLPRQQYFFSTSALYQFHLSRVAAGDKAKKPTGKADVVLRLQFANPTPDGRQPVTFTIVRDGNETKVDKTAQNQAILTTTLAQADTPTANDLTVDGKAITLFAGLREDPFFFDVEQFFKVRAHALATGTFLGFLPAAQAKDFTHNYNVNAIVLRVPIALLQTGAGEPVFDVWTTIMVPQK